MTIVVSNDSLGRGIEQAGSALGQALGLRGQRQYEKQVREEEFRKQEALQAQNRQRAAQSGTILQSLLSQLPQNASAQQINSALVQAIQQGADPSIVQEVMKGYAPILKESARTAGAQNFFQQLFGAPMGGATAPVEGAEIITGQTPQGNFAAGQFDISQVPDQQLVLAAAAPYKEIADLANAELKRRDLDYKRFSDNRKYEGELSTPYLKKIDDSRDAVRTKENASELMINAIEEGNLDFFSKDNLANFLGRYGEGLRTLKGAQLLNAQKEFLLGNIQRAGSRPNQWIEQQISGMLAKVGRSREANLGVAEALRAETALERKKIELADELAARYRKELGYVPADIGAQVDRQLSAYAQEVQNQLAYRLRQLYEEEIGNDLSKQASKTVPTGTPLTVNMAKVLIQKYKTVDKAIENAKKLGYTIYPLEEIQRWQR